jgi:hypothetical protein
MLWGQGPTKHAWNLSAFRIRSHEDMKDIEAKLQASFTSALGVGSCFVVYVFTRKLDDSIVNAAIKRIRIRGSLRNITDR